MKRRRAKATPSDRDERDEIATPSAPDRARRRTLAALIVGSAWVVSLGGYLLWDRRRAAAAGDVAGDFVHDLYSGSPARAYAATSRRFRSLNDPASFAAQYPLARSDVALRLESHTFHDGRATFDGHITMGAGLPTVIRIVLVDEDGWKVDSFALGL